MKRSSYLQLGALGIFVLGGAVTIGVCENRWGSTNKSPWQAERAVSERQVLERRRGRMAEVAITGTTVQ